VRGAGRVVEEPLTLERDFKGATAVVMVVEEARRRRGTRDCKEEDKQRSCCLRRLRGMW
jgi:hypothetical protein